MARKLDMPAWSPLLAQAMIGIHERLDDLAVLKIYGRSMSLTMPATELLVQPLAQSSARAKGNHLPFGDGHRFPGLWIAATAWRFITDRQYTELDQLYQFPGDQRFFHRCKNSIDNITSTSMRDAQLFINRIGQFLAGHILHSLILHVNGWHLYILSSGVWQKGNPSPLTDKRSQAEHTIYPQGGIILRILRMCFR